MKKVFLILALMANGFCLANAQSETKMEAEEATYENCELVDNDLYSG